MMIPEWESAGNSSFKGPPQQQAVAKRRRHGLDAKAIERHVDLARWQQRLAFAAVCLFLVVGYATIFLCRHHGDNGLAMAAFVPASRGVVTCFITHAGKSAPRL